MRILQFIPHGSEALMRRLLRGVQAQAGPDQIGPAVLPVLDLEDGHWILGDEEGTAARKQAARSRLLALADEGIGAWMPVALRLNAVDTAEFRRDLPVASRLAACQGLEVVLLPKLSASRRCR